VTDSSQIEFRANLIDLFVVQPHCSVSKTARWNLSPATGRWAAERSQVTAELTGWATSGQGPATTSPLGAPSRRERTENPRRYWVIMKTLSPGKKHRLSCSWIPWALSYIHCDSLSTIRPLLLLNYLTTATTVDTLLACSMFPCAPRVEAWSLKVVKQTFVDDWSEIFLRGWMQSC